MKTRCSFCGANIRESIEYNIECIQECVNCQADLKMEGKWTGIAQNIMSTLIGKYGLEEVRLTFEKVKFNQI